MQKLKVVDNFFSLEDIEFIKNQVEDISKEEDILGSDKLNGWHPSLNTSSNPVKIYYIDPTIDSEIYNMVSEKMKKEFGMEIKAILFHFWTNGSYINWHNDHGHGGAATVYLNYKWETDWGGLFTYEIDNKLGIEKPKYNKCVFQSGEVLHATTPVTENAPIRKSLQVFFK